MDRKNIPSVSQHIARLPQQALAAQPRADAEPQAISGSETNRLSVVILNSGSASNGAAPCAPPPRVSPTTAMVLHQQGARRAPSQGMISISCPAEAGASRPADAPPAAASKFGESAQARAWGNEEGNEGGDEGEAATTGGARITGPTAAQTASPFWHVEKALRRQTKGSKIRGKIGTKWDRRDWPKGHQPTASRCDLRL